MCCRWGECVVGGRATFGPPLQMGDATRCWGVRRGVWGSATRYATSLQKNR